MAINTQRKRLRRTLMLTPGNRPERLAKTVELDADAVAFDLEDGVAPDHKPAARSFINQQLEALDFGHRERVVRINAIGTEDYQADLAQVSFANADSVFVPKVETADELKALDNALTTIEMTAHRRTPIDVIATIETPRGLLNALAIADAIPRTSALFFGSGDYSAATGAAVTEAALAFPRATLVAAAAAAGLQAIDAAYFTSVKDARATEADALTAKELGFEGKVIFHPNQIAPCNAVFSPTDQEITRAQTIVDAHIQAKAQGMGTLYVDGEFIAIDIVIMAQRVLARADQIATRQAGAAT